MARDPHPAIGHHHENPVADEEEQQVEGMATVEMTTVRHPDAPKSSATAVSPKDWEAIKTLTDFKSILKEKKHTLLIVIFTAEWCRPCHQMNFALPSVIQMFPEVLFYKIDVDENLETANTYSIACVPTVRIYCNEKKLHENFGWNSDRLTRAINVCKDLYKSQLMPSGAAMPGPQALSAISSANIHSTYHKREDKAILLNQDPVHRI